MQVERKNESGSRSSFTADSVMATMLKPRRFRRATERVPKRYSADLSDSEWEIIQLLLPLLKARGRKRQVCQREILNAIFYQTHNDCIWSDLLKDLPAYQTVCNYFRRWQRKGVWQQIYHVLRREVRLSVGKQPQPVLGASIVNPSKRRKKGGGLQP
jgi:putative transposase